MANTAKLGIEKDFYDYALDNYDYIQIEQLNENFQPAPAISVAEYKARTSKNLPKGVFDEHELPGVSCQEVKMDLLEPVLTRSLKECSNHVIADSSVFSECAERMSNQKSSFLKDVGNPQTITSNKGKNQKKKKKFRKLEFTNTQPSTVYNVPFVPDISYNSNTDQAYLPL